MGVETCDQHQYLDVYKHIHLTQLKNSKCRNMLQMNTLIIWKNIYSKSTSKTHQPVRLSISNIIPTLERLATIQNYKYWLTAIATAHFCDEHNYVCDTEPIKAHKQEVWRCAGYRKHQCERCVLLIRGRYLCGTMLCFAPVRVWNNVLHSTINSHQVLLCTVCSYENNTTAFL